MVSSSKPYVLIADSDPAYLATVKKLIEMDDVLRGYTVWTAGSAVETIRTMHTLDRDTIFVVDFLLEDMDGYRLLKENVRQTFRFGSSQCIVTSHKDQELEDKAMGDHILWKQKRKIKRSHRKEASLQSILSQYRSLINYGEKDIAQGLLVDPLTKCITRQHAFEFWKHDFARARRDYKPMSCIYADLNDLKRVNDDDKYGHHVGDQMILEVSQALQLHVRNNFDYVIRWGGDEFVIILPQSDLHVAKEIVKRIRDDISKIQIPVPHGHLCPGVALGTSVLRAAHMGRDPTTALKKLVKNSEQAMYRDKRLAKSSL